MSAESASSPESITDDQASDGSNSAPDPNSESTQHSTGTRRLKRLTKASGKSAIAIKAALRTSRTSESRIQISQPQDLIGVTLATNRYLVKSQLGKGSMAYVFLAEDRRLETDVVIKVPKPELFTTQDFRERFKRESQLLVRFSHPHVVGVLDVGEYDGLPYVVMPLLSGGSLLDRMKKDRSDKRQTDPESLKSWLPGVAKALDFCCRKGMVHRDVKPANILFDDDNNAFVGDFGLSKVMYGEHTELNSSETMAGVVLGTPNYVSPEVIHGKPYDGRADQYSLGITVYQLLFGRAPMQGPSPTVTMINQTQRKLQLLSEIRSDVSQELALAIQKSIEKKPEDRFACCEDFADAVLEGLRAQSETDSPAPSPAAPISQTTEALAIDVEPVEAIVDTEPATPTGDDLNWLNLNLEAIPAPTFSTPTNDTKVVEKPKLDKIAAEPRRPRKTRTSPATYRSGSVSGSASAAMKRLRDTLNSWRERSSRKSVMLLSVSVLAALGLATGLCWMLWPSADANTESPVATRPASSDTATTSTQEESTQKEPSESPSGSDDTTQAASPFGATDAMLREMKKDKAAPVWEWKSETPTSTGTKKKSN